MLRSVSNQITGEAAVQRNKMAEEFKRQGYRADVAYDMANFQIIGHHQHLGGEAMKAQIAATSTGISGMDGLAAPVKQDYLEKGPETISHDGLKSQIGLFRLFGETGSSMVPWSRSELAREKDAAKFPS